MASTRLPGKVLMDIGGRTALARVVRRLSRATLINEVVVAASNLPADAAIVRECERLDIPCFRGSEADVLDRYYWAAKNFDVDAVVRITSDCPLIDPQLVDEIIQVFATEEADYASNVIPRTYPRGLDTEVFTTEALAWAWLEAREPHQREHVTPYFYEHPGTFKIASAAGDADFSHHRWTLDTPEDLELIRAIYFRFDDRDDFSWRDVLDLTEREPELSQLNAHIVQKAVLAG